MSQPDRLLEQAKQVIERSYSPYSLQKVASSVLTDTNEIFTGVNVENASFGVTICAERVALGTAISSGAKSISAVLVLTKAHHPWSPCGMCRQMISEFANPETLIYIANLEGIKRVAKLGDLLADAPPKSWA